MPVYRFTFETRAADDEHAAAFLEAAAQLLGGVTRTYPPVRLVGDEPSPPSSPVAALGRYSRRVRDDELEGGR